MSPDVHTLAGAYAADALPDDERRTFRAHLAVCDACTVEVRELQATTARLARAVAEPPPPSLRDAVLAEADRIRQERPATGPAATASHPRWYDRVLAPAAAVLAIAVIGLGAVVVHLESRLSELQAREAALPAVLTAGDVRLVDLAGTAAATARIVYAPGAGEAVLLADGLAPAPEGQVYELWLIDAGGATPAGLFDADPRGRVRHPVPGDLAGVTAVAVTLEPSGGSPQPTSDPILVAELA